MDKRNFAFDRINFLWLPGGMRIVIFGFILLSEGKTPATHFDPAIFSVRRIKVAPIICLVGFVSMIYAIIRKPKDELNN